MITVEDWSHPLAPAMPTFEAFWHRQVSFETIGSFSQVGRQTSLVHIGTHSGTHVDAPSHFIEGGKSISDFGVDCLMGNVLVMNVGHHAQGGLDPDSEPIRSLSAVKNIEGLVLNFGWTKRWGSKEYYSEQPFLSEGAAMKLVDLGIKFLGYDLPMPDNPSEGRNHPMDSRIHKIFLSREVLLVENLRIPEGAEGMYYSYSTPMNLKGLDGSPVRFVMGRQ